METLFVERQREHAIALGATFLIAEDSGHMIPLEAPELVAEAIQGLVEQHQGS